MRIARIQTDHGIVGVIEKDGRWVEVDDILIPEPHPTGVTHPLDGAAFACPVVPTLIFGMLHNTGPADREKPPQAFMKSPRGAIGPGQKILIDHHLGAVKGEGELALVVGATTRFVTPEHARDCVLGFTCGNDITNLDQIALDATFVQGKAGDGYTPLGPWIETDLDALDAAITVALDGKQVAASSTARLAYNPYEALSHLSRYLTLGPGDVILTGAPDTSNPLETGQTMSITIAGIGTLTNQAAPHPRAMGE